MTDQRFPDVPGGYPFPRLELEVLDHWRRARIFERSLEATVGGPEFVFYEGPPTANNVPHVGHVVTRAVKDLFPRYRTMRGYHVRRKAGWDTHGLPVEIEVEKQLGFTGKEEIEAYGIEAFNRACLESVDRYEREWRRMTERVGFWIDLDDAYFTYTNGYVESVWWALAHLFQRGLLFEGYKIQPYCARCGTTLSSHEVAQNYKDAEDPSVWVLFPVRPGQRVTTADGGSYTTAPGLSVVAWTTTPWTTLAHVALAVHPELVYRVVAHPEDEERRILFAGGLDEPVPVVVEADGERRKVDLSEQPTLARFRGCDLEGLRYDRPFSTGGGEPPSGYTPEHTFDPPPSNEAGWAVVLGDYVTTDEGTGVVHTAPLFGEDDYRTGCSYRLPFYRTVDSKGQVADLPGIEPFAGRWFKEADPEITRDLSRRGLLLHAERYHHNYPFCWRCDQPLLYYATTSWFVRTTDPQVKAALLAKNEAIGWRPEHVGTGRFGNWLENVVDWALSRRRYWGTPLPVWRCDACDHTEAVGSFAELFRKAGKEPPADLLDRELFDPHRPFVDRDAADPFVWPCGECGEGTMGRVADVIDAWFDSGSMPYAQHHYTGEPVPGFDPERGVGFPADFIAEAIDQTRGWFYTLHALGVLLFGSEAYRNCIVLGHVADEEGRKMSKRLGNVVEPMEVIEETGADALRWYFYVNNPLVNARFSARLVREAAGSLLLPLWNALSFFTIYANLDGWRPGRAHETAAGERPALDRWVLSALDRLVASVTEHLDAYRITEAACEIEAFVDSLTNWYIRRSRDRFWSARSDASETDKESAYRALYEVLTTLARLIAPMTPFLADVLHRHLVRSLYGEEGEEGAASVHLEAWPEPVAGRSEDELERAMAAIQRIVRLGHAARNQHGIKTRQPLAAVTLVAADESLPGLVEPHEDLLTDELNVRRIRWAAERREYVHHEVKPHFPKTGPRFGKRMKEVQAALGEADGDELAASLERDGKVTIELSDGPVELSAEELEVRLVEREGTATQGDRELLVALDTELTDDLVAEGWAREVVHKLQTARKDEDLDYADRIRVRYAADPELAAAVERHRGWIAEQTLAVELAPVGGAGAGADGDGLSTAARRSQVEEMAFAFDLERV